MKKSRIQDNLNLRIINRTNNRIISENAELADTYRKRLVGLIGRTNLSVSEALILKPCNSIHTFWMKFPIDAVFLDSEHKICHLIADMRKNRISKLSLQAKCVIELHAGQIKAHNMKVGDQLEITKDPY